MKKCHYQVNTFNQECKETEMVLSLILMVLTLSLNVHSIPYITKLRRESSMSLSLKLFLRRDTICYMRARIKSQGKVKGFNHYRQSRSYLRLLWRWFSMDILDHNPCNSHSCNINCMYGYHLTLVARRRRSWDKQHPEI